MSSKVDTRKLAEGASLTFFSVIFCNETFILSFISVFLYWWFHLPSFTKKCCFHSIDFVIHLPPFTKKKKCQDQEIALIMLDRLVDGTTNHVP
jgi:hypothetical protein